VLRAPKCILAGDDKQLPPTIISNEYGPVVYQLIVLHYFAIIYRASKVLSLTMMERLRKLYGKTVTATLITQYR
jgi:superfamily I DNA and/or RNA helicase